MRGTAPEFPAALRTSAQAGARFGGRTLGPHAPRARLARRGRAMPMWSTDVLREEHRWILRMLACLERVRAEAEAAGRVAAGPASELVALFRHFADGLHQEREERFLFPRLLARSRSVQERMDVGRLCGDHEEERRALARLSGELLGAIYGRGESLRQFVREAGRYVEMQRAHLAHENRALLPLAETLLTPEDDELVMHGFARLERDGGADPREVLERVRALCAQLGVEPG